jgi:hypothetical protein
MNRAEFIKTFSVFGATSVLPLEQLFGKPHTRKLHLIGLGDAGTGMIKYCSEKNNSLQYTIINTHFKEKYNAGFQFVEFDRPSNAYLENNQALKKVNIETVKKNNSLPQNIAPFFSDKSKHYVLFSSLGGFTGSYLTLQLSKQLQKRGLKYTTIVNIPPYIMSPFRRTAALTIKEELNTIDNIHFFDSENLRSLYGNYRMKDQYTLANKELYKIFKVKACT